MPASGNLGEVYKGQKLHVRVVMEGFLEGNDIMSNALVDMYVKCDMLCQAKDIVNRLQTWDIVVRSTRVVSHLFELDCYISTSSNSRMKNLS